MPPHRDNCDALDAPPKIVTDVSNQGVYFSSKHWFTPNGNARHIFGSVRKLPKLDAINSSLYGTSTYYTP